YGRWGFCGGSGHPRDSAYRWGCRSRAGHIFMTLLSICQNAAHNVGIAAPGAIVGSTNPSAVRLLQMARRTGMSLMKRANWTALTTEHVFIADGTSSYPLPGDFRS